jgi:hypothetical protein
MQTHPQTSPVTDSWVNPTHVKDLMTYMTASNSGKFSGMASIVPAYCSIQGLSLQPNDHKLNLPLTAGMQHIPMYYSLSRTQKCL